MPRSSEWLVDSVRQRWSQCLWWGDQLITMFPWSTSSPIVSLGWIYIQGIWARSFCIQPPTHLIPWIFNDWRQFTIVENTPSFPCLYIVILFQYLLWSCIWIFVFVFCICIVNFVFGLDLHWFLPTINPWEEEAITHAANHSTKPSKAPSIASFGKVHRL